MYEDVPSDDMQQTQEDQVQTQPLTQPDSNETNEEHWGYLNPCLSQSIKRVTLYKTEKEVTIGRNTSNNVVFPGFKISNFHATIRWNGLENAASIVTIEDTSSNGTFINGEKIGKGQQRLLKDGNEVAFGVATRSTEQGGLFDYRFIFRDLVSGVVKRALYNSYDLSTELGKGSFATVYKALHMASGEWVAVKVIHETKRQGGPPPATASEATRLGRSQTQSREISIMENLRHPNICQLREVFWNANGSIDLVLELIEGGDLLDYILTNNGLTEDVSKHITYQLCQALAYIHEKGITHRDLKPENVLLTTDKPPIVKVADFGLAKIVDSMTMLKTMCGTPSYLAPEVVTQQNSSGYDSLVDSWSVGVILFSMLTNTTPFIESSVDDLRTRIAERRIEWSQLESLGLSNEAIDFIRRLLEYDPRYRMKLSDALSHSWFQGYVFAHPLDYPTVNRAGSTSTGSLSEDVSMRTADQLSFTGEAEAVSQGFEHLKLNGSVGASTSAVASAIANGDAAEAEAVQEGEGRLTPSNTPPGLTLHKKGGLQRRADVLSQAVETGRALVEPSWEMVNYAQSQSQESEDLYRPASPAPETTGECSTTPSNPLPTPPPTIANPPASGNGKGPNKRVHSELTPLPEEMDGVAGTEGSSPLSSPEDSPPGPVSEPLRKKGRSEEDAGEAEAGTPSKATRGKRGAVATGKASTSTATRKVKAKVDSSVEDTPAGTRRSTRAKTGKR
ncbi:Pkinase-domain-containing protein [Mycena venus]|uniref:Pkinase-domain-containing protein n=1 Tax=Mycena venus TaxID=2733690 RepID=A0A8H6YFQ9_9AGAR|nr:Pkinase-domain-containing protein [Mycena venus]